MIYQPRIEQPDWSEFTTMVQALLVSLSEGQQQHTNAGTRSTNKCKDVTCSWLVNMIT